MKNTDPPSWVKAKKVVYLVLCKDGTPHPGVEPKPTYEDAQKVAVDDLQECGPHRVQAYRPMI